MGYQTRIDVFYNYFACIKRDGIKDLYSFLLDSDFFYAPASTRFHGNYDGGLVDHSCHVYEQLIPKVRNMQINPETVYIVGLLHDLCKVNYYDISYRNKKVYKDDGKKKDEKGKFDWVVEPFYTVKENGPYPHAEQSLKIIKKFITLTEEEELAIRWHMGFTEPKEHWNNFTSAIKIYPLVLLLHEADMEATYFRDKTV